MHYNIEKIEFQGRVIQDYLANRAILCICFRSRSFRKQISRLGFPRHRPGILIKIIVLNNFRSLVLLALCSCQLLKIVKIVPNMSWILADIKSLFPLSQTAISSIPQPGDEARSFKSDPSKDGDATSSLEYPLASRKPSLLVFVRHLGCPFCQESVH